MPVFRSHSDWKAGEVEQFDTVFVFGLRGKGRSILDSYPEAYVVDYGFMRRVMGVDTFKTGHWQICRGGLGRICSDACPPDRFRALGLELRPERPPTAPRVLCAQSVGDASHPFDTHAKLRAWADSVPHDEYRPHPLDAPAGLEPLDAMLERAGTVVTWNSTVGIDAMLAGVAVEAHGPACYRGVQNRQEFFNRLAYSQWTMAEMAAGLPFQRIH